MIQQVAASAVDTLPLSFIVFWKQTQSFFFACIISCGRGSARLNALVDVLLSSAVQVGICSKLHLAYSQDLTHPCSITKLEVRGWCDDPRIQGDNVPESPLMLRRVIMFQCTGHLPTQRKLLNLNWFQQVRVPDKVPLPAEATEEPAKLKEEAGRDRYQRWRQLVIRSNNPFMWALYLNLQVYKFCAFSPETYDTKRQKFYISWRSLYFLYIHTWKSSKRSMKGVSFA